LVDTETGTRSCCCHEQLKLGVSTCCGITGSPGQEGVREAPLERVDEMRVEQAVAEHLQDVPELLDVLEGLNRLSPSLGIILPPDHASGVFHHAAYPGQPAVLTGAAKLRMALEPPSDGRGHLGQCEMCEVIRTEQPDLEPFRSANPNSRRAPACDGVTMAGRQRFEEEGSDRTADPNRFVNQKRPVKQRVREFYPPIPSARSEP
jgi:hypothetical protein